MYGAILGDIIGSPYEFNRGDKTKDFPLFSERSRFTDDTVMTIAVADAFLDAQPNADDEWIKNRLIKGMQRFARSIRVLAMASGLTCGFRSRSLFHTTASVMALPCASPL